MSKVEKMSEKLTDKTRKKSEQQKLPEIKKKKRDAKAKTSILNNPKITNKYYEGNGGVEIKEVGITCGCNSKGKNKGGGCNTFRCKCIKDKNGDCVNCSCKDCRNTAQVRQLLFTKKQSTKRKRVGE